MIIFIGGSVNSGKTTTGRLVAKRLGAEFIDVDTIDLAAPNFDLNSSREVPDVLDRVIKRLQGLPADKSAVLSYVLRPQDYEQLRRGLTGRHLFFVTLVPQLEVALADRGGRQLSQWERDMVHYQYGNYSDKVDYGQIIDNSQLSAAETADRILGYLGSK